MLRKLFSTRVLLPPARLNKHLYPAFSTFRTSESNPMNFDASHLGRFYTMDHEVYKLLYGATDKGVGLPSIYKVQCSTFREICFMVRKPFLDVKKCIESYDISRLPVMRYVLYGEPGTGKSITIANLAHYGHEAGFLLVHVPWAPTWTKWTKEAIPSTTRPEYYDHTVDAVFWLTFFRHQNSKLLSQLQLKTTKEFKWSEREFTPEGSDITDIIEHGIARPVHASECIYALLQELKVLSTQQKCKTMVLIDGVNGWYTDPRNIKRPDKSIVPFQLFTVYEAFKQTFESDWTNGVVIVSVCEQALLGIFRESHTPRSLLNKQGWEEFDPFVPIRVEKYTSQEVQTTIDYYLDRKWLQHPLAGTPEARLELETISIQNPFSLMQICNGR